MSGVNDYSSSRVAENWTSRLTLQVIQEKYDQTPSQILILCFHNVHKKSYVQSHPNAKLTDSTQVLDVLSAKQYAFNFSQKIHCFKPLPAFRL